MDDNNHLETTIFLYFLCIWYFFTTLLLILYQSGLAVATLSKSLSFWDLVNAPILNVNCSKSSQQAFQNNFYSHL